MKKFFILLVLSFISNFPGFAQKFGYTDMEFITSKMPEYQQAQGEMKKFSVKWAKEIDDKFAEIARMQRAFMAEEVLLTDDLKRKKQTEIKEKEIEAREYNSKIFGMEGLLFQKKKELMKPVLEKVQRSVLKVCRQRRLDFMFDKSSDVGLLYTNPVYDYTDWIMEDLGIVIPKAGKKAEPVPPVENPTKQKSTTSKLK